MDKKKEIPPLPEELLNLIAGDDPADYWTQIHKWVGNLSKTTMNVEEILHALHSLNTALSDKGAFMKMIQSLANLNRTQTQKSTNSQGGNAGSNKNNVTKTPAKQGQNSNDNKMESGQNLTGDSLYDIFNSPAMREIVREVMKQKGKKKW
ncbi:MULTISPECIES: hypothetical protein [Thermoactinomyces]|jgi:hypothetical protein|uniref:Uncharacterized protein n=1 Tax=Thermoactinomyces daqus TaxID=1329516 RepID=A0A7W1X7V6_9BACL|nr:MULTISPECIES: hypothetical protein [Thermoactinomyces]MBA4541713.1 hypothetical protein [Thermoactinomyces daqus]MBH8597202.1 hypothetical protein [Thermoactinomyces sp. CICC 10523]MBH8602762.1 hypothetical protein [Thermoactinomyces sp. CICC 10522]MBH8606129.1 hypothetical protein [Thermoactinomyces sp. CICC 10521]